MITMIMLIELLRRDDSGVSRNNCANNACDRMAAVARHAAIKKWCIIDVYIFLEQNNIFTC